MPGVDLGAVAARCRALAVEFQCGRFREALLEFQPLVPQIQSSLADRPRLTQARGRRLDEIRINDLPLVSLIRSLQGIMLELNQAVKNRDGTTLADLLEEDLPAALEVLQEVRAQLGG